MAQVFVIGSITADLELRASSKKVPYIRFGLTEKIGYGDQSTRQYYQVWAFGPEAERLARMNVKRGALFWVSGQLRLVDNLGPNGSGTDKILKIMFKDGGYVPGIDQRTRSADAPSPTPPAGTASAQPSPPWEGRLDGDRDPLPG